ncbi:MAG: sulfate adenylyltransferase, partial [Phycisphaerales bacterium]|nr:sulfate adenylyltransferase [Phycisphaerales bacterium]
MSLVAPHGGSLVNRILSADAAEKAKAAAKGLTQVTLSLREQGDWELLAIGGFSPLKGFMGQKDFTRVCNEMRLADGTVWPIPVILSPADDVTAKINVGDTIALNDSNGKLLGTMKVTEKYAHDKALENKVYGTDDAKHPGIAVTAKQGSFNLAGDIDAVSINNDPEFPEFRLTPTQTRAAFAEKKWETVTAFQTRNP